MKTTTKRLSALLLAIMLVLSMMLAGCSRPGAKENPSTRPGKTQVEEPAKNNEENVSKRPGSGKEMTSEEIAAYSKSRVVKVVTDTGNGSGFFIDDEGTLITNYHVIEGAEELSIKFDDGATYAVNTIVDFSPFYDIAVLKVDISGNDYFKLATQYTEGESVYVRGYPKNVETSSFTSGMLSQTQHRLGLMDCITIDAAISGGNSGGPAINNRGEVLGICSYTRTDAQNMNFAIKLTALDELSMDKNYSINRYREWYNKETGRSYMGTADGRNFFYTYVHTYTNETDVKCLASTDDMDTYENGYSIMFMYYMYDYDSQNYDKYCDYLNSIGFEFVDEVREMGLEGVEYYHAFEGYSICMFIDTVNNLLLVSCPLR